MGFETLEFRVWLRVHCRAKRKRLARVERLLPESQGHNLALKNTDGKNTDGTAVGGSKFAATASKVAGAPLASCRFLCMPHPLDSGKVRGVHLAPPLLPGTRGGAGYALKPRRILAGQGGNWQDRSTVGKDRAAIGKTRRVLRGAPNTPPRPQQPPLAAAGMPLSSEYGTHKAVKARFWPWLSGGSP